MNYTTKEQVQAILESIVPSNWIQEDVEKDLENVKKENLSDVLRNQKHN